MSRGDALARDLTRQLGAASVRGGGGEPVCVLPDRAETVQAVYRWAHREGVDVRSAHLRALKPARRTGPDPVLISSERLTPPLVLNQDAGTVRVGAGATGAQLAHDLHRSGRCPWPRTAAFLRERLGSYLSGPGLSAEFVAFTMWESPLMALEGVLVDGRRIHAGVAPRSAAGPDYRTFFLGTGDRLGMITSVVWRTVDRSVLRLFALRFERAAAALEAAREHCAAGWRPFSGWIGRGEPDSWRRGGESGPGLLLLAHRADGLRADLLDERLRGLATDHGAEVLPSRAAREWLEQTFVHVCQRGPSALACAGPARLGGQLGTLRVSVPWPGAGPLWAALERLGAKGPLRLTIAAEAPRPEGTTLHLRIRRRGRSRIGLPRALERIAPLLGEHGGWIAGLHDREGRAMEPPRHRTAANELLDAVASSLRGTARAAGREEV